MEVYMQVSDEYEKDNSSLSAILGEIAIALDIESRVFNSMTIQRKKINKGFKPDSCFYIQSLKLFVRKTNIGIDNETPPDLIIEVNQIVPSMTRMQIYAAFGVKEVWRFNRKLVKFYTLADGVYLEMKNSIALPILSNRQAAEFLLESRKMKYSAWSKRIREWARKETMKAEDRP